MIRVAPTTAASTQGTDSPLSNRHSACDYSSNWSFSLSLSLSLSASLSFTPPPSFSLSLFLFYFTLFLLSLSSSPPLLLLSPSITFYISFLSYSSAYSLPLFVFPCLCVGSRGIFVSPSRPLELASKLASPRPSATPQLLVRVFHLSHTFFPFLFSSFVLPSFPTLFFYLSLHLSSSSCSICSMYIIYTSLAPDHRAVARVLVQPAKDRIS